MNVKRADLIVYYKSLSDDQIYKLAKESHTLTSDAIIVLREEAERRSLDVQIIDAQVDFKDVEGQQAKQNVITPRIRNISKALIAMFIGSIVGVQVQDFFTAEPDLVYREISGSGAELLIYPDSKETKSKRNEGYRIPLRIQEDDLGIFKEMFSFQRMQQQLRILRPDLFENPIIRSIDSLAANKYEFQTHKMLIIANQGRKEAKDVVISYKTVPVFLSIIPPLDYEVENSNSVYKIRIPVIGSHEIVWIEAIFKGIAEKPSNFIRYEKGAVRRM